MMAYQLIYTNSFKKDLRLAKKRNYDMKKNGRGFDIVKIRQKTSSKIQGSSTKRKSIKI